VRAARKAIDASGGHTLLIGRAECFLTGPADLGEALKRLQADSQAGADCLYAPGVVSAEDIAALVKGVAPKPFNLLVLASNKMTMQEIAALGVRRVSVGGALARSAWGGFLRAARMIADQGRFDGFADAAPGREMNGFFGEDAKKR
jgi:2-methylisocitrate lyase-like PEP mutase family enzyme